VVTQLLKSAADPTTSPNPSSANTTTTSLRLLVSHNLMGSIIGRSGAKIKAIQDTSGARMVASKDMLPQSTERVVEIQGSAESIERAIIDIGKALLEDWERGTGTVLYHPGSSDDRSKKHGAGANGGRRANANTNGDSAQPRSTPSPVANGVQLRTQNISIPSDMVGCIIGRGGTKITEIRRLSGAKISIAKTPHDETGERMFTIVGTPEANEKALFLLYNQLESEKERRVGKEQQAAQTE
jgi:heterogeneous nuclear rnp K-like protein